MREAEHLYTLHKDLLFNTGLVGINHSTRYVELFEDGTMIVRKGFPSDGCSPKYLVAGLFHIGTPDGPYDPDQDMPVTGRAFFGHDAIIMILRDLGSTSCDDFSKAHELFCAEIMKRDFWPKRIYCFIVKHFGPKK